jgi:hypothetical protein
VPGVVLREAINRMRAVIRAVRDHMTELGATRAHATCASFMGKDHYDAWKFLYPALRFSDSRILPVSQILNSPNSPIILEEDPSLTLPGPDASIA